MMIRTRFVVQVYDTADSLIKSSINRFGHPGYFEWLEKDEKIISITRLPVEESYGPLAFRLLIVCEKEVIDGPANCHYEEIESVLCPICRNE